MSRESLSIPVRVPRSESLSWNPILELLETSSILARLQTSKHREIDYEEDIARSTNGKFTKGHGSEGIYFKIQGVRPWKFSEGESVACIASENFEFELVGFEKRKAEWYVAVNERPENWKKTGFGQGDLEEWFIPVDEILDSRQIVSFEVFPASRQ